MTLTEKHPSFEKWRNDCLISSVKIAITLSYSENEFLQNFTCPVSLCVMDVPTHTPSGIFYDMTFLMNCPRESNGNIKDPNRNPSFPAIKAMPDFERSFVIHKKTQALLRADLLALATNDDLGSVVHQQLVEIEKALENRYENGREIIENRRRTRAVTHEQYKIEIAEFERLYGTDWEQELDWGVDWLTTLNERWVYFHPDAKIIGYN